MPIPLGFKMFNCFWSASIKNDWVMATVTELSCKREKNVTMIVEKLIRSFLRLQMSGENLQLFFRWTGKKLYDIFNIVLIFRHPLHRCINSLMHIDIGIRGFAEKFSDHLKRNFKKLFFVWSFGQNCGLDQ